MSRHDLIAEMQGLSEELAVYEQYRRSDRATAVREQMGFVRAEGARRAGLLDAEADRLEMVGQHMGAGQRREHAEALRAGLGITGEPEDADGDDQDDEAGPPENAAEATPRETAVPKKAARGRPRKGG